MAHHQGMNLVSLANLLADGPFVRWFHASRRVQAVELLLQERVPVGVVGSAPRARPQELRRRWLRKRSTTTPRAAAARRAGPADPEDPA
jgi:hypothetical protein